MMVLSELARGRAWLPGIDALGDISPVRALAFALSLTFTAIVFTAGFAALASRTSSSGPQPDQSDATAIALSQAAQAEDGLVAHGAASVSADANLPGEAGYIARATNGFVGAVRGAYSDYYDTLSTMDYYQLLAPIRLASDPGFADTNRTLETMRNAVETRERRIDAAVAAFRGQLASARIGGGAKRAALTHLDDAVARSAVLRNRETALEVNLIDEQKQLLADLAAAKNDWRATGPTTLVFNDESAMKTYRAHVAALVRIAGALDTMIGRDRPNPA